MTDKQREIYPERIKAYDNERLKLNAANITPINKELILRFQDHLFSKGAQKMRVAKLSAQLRKITSWLKILEIDKNLDKITSKDLTRLIAYINRQESLALATRADYRRCIKQFYRWYRYEDDRFYAKQDEIKRDAEKLYHYIQTQVTASFKNKDIDPATIITNEDIQKVIAQGTNSLKEKAFLDLLQETGMRIGEFLNLRIENIEFLEHHAKITIPYGKTGSRQIFILRSIPTLKRYLVYTNSKMTLKAIYGSQTALKIEGVQCIMVALQR